METLVVVAVLVAFFTFVVARATAKPKLGLAEVECLGEQLALDEATMKSAVAVVNVLGGSVTVVGDAAKEQVRNAKLKGSNDSEIRDAERKVAELTRHNRDLRERNRVLEEILTLQPPAPAK